MKLFLTIILSLFSIGLINAQEITLMYQKTDHIPLKKIKSFEYIDSQMDLTNDTILADYKLRIDQQGKKSLTPVFQKLWELANKMGANSYSINNVSSEDGQYLVDVSLYYLDEEKMQANFSHYEENIIIIFGDINTKKLDKLKSCKVNGEKISILPYSYSLFRNEIGEKLKISVGGFMGSAVWITGEPDKLGRCFSLGGVTLMPSVGIGIGPASGGGVGVSISTGSIYPMSLNFGLFTMTILDTIKNDDVEL